MSRLQSTLAQRLKHLRHERGYTIKEAAQFMNVAESTYRDWEYGRKIKGEPYVRLAQVYGVSVTWLMTGEEKGIEGELRELEKLIKKIRSKL